MNKCFSNSNNINLKALKSPLLKILFSFINEKKKLNIILNNKSIEE